MGNFSHYEERTARKSHTCTRCGTTITPGSTYHHQRGRSEGYWYTVKWCGWCRPHVDTVGDDPWYTPTKWAEKLEEAGHDLEGANLIWMEGKPLEGWPDNRENCVYYSRRMGSLEPRGLSWWGPWRKTDSLDDELRGAPGQ